MHIFQMISGVIFTLLTAAGLYMAYSERSNVFFVTAMLFLIIALSCYILAAVRIRKRRRNRDITNDPEDSPDTDGSSEVMTEPDSAQEYDYNDNNNIQGDNQEIPLTEDRIVPDTDAADEPPVPEINPAAPQPGAPEEEIAFFEEFETDLSRMDAEILLTNQRISVTEDDIRQMTKTELEDYILHTQIAINAFNRMKIFCEGKGSAGTGYYEERMQKHAENPSFLSFEQVTRQMDLLQETYESYTETNDGQTGKDSSES